MRNRRPSSKASSPSGGRGAIRLRLAKAARADLIAIDAYSAAQFGDDAADDYARGFREAFALLRTHPLAGAEWSELGRGIRHLIHKRHRIFYRVSKGEVLVLRIIHHARDANSALGRAK